MQTFIDPEGLAITYGFDSANRTIPRGDLTFTYQPEGKLDTATTFDGQTLDFTYDGPVLTDALWAGTINGSVERTSDNSLRLESLRVNGADPISYPRSRGHRRRRSLVGDVRQVGSALRRSWESPRAAPPSGR